MEEIEATDSSGVVETPAGALADFARVGSRRIVSEGDTEIAVFRMPQGLVAFENRCPHQGGPIGLGVVAPKVTATVDANGQVTESFSSTEMQIVCPWHAWEFDPASGRCTADGRWGLQRREVVVRDDNVYVRARG